MRKLVSVSLLVAAAVLLGWLAGLEVPVVSPLAAVVLWAAGVLALLWLLWRGLSLFLWRVGRRLAFSYFLIGVLPIPMVLCLFLLVAYIHSGFFIGHLYRDAVAGLHADLAAAAALQLDLPADRRAEPGGDGRSYAYYRDGRRVAGSAAAPSRFPDWLTGEAPRLPTTDGATGRERVLPFVALGDGSPTVAAVAARRGAGVVVWWSGDVEAELARRSDVAVRLTRSDDPGKENLVQLSLFGKEISLQPPGAGWGGDASAPAAPDGPPPPPGAAAEAPAGDAAAPPPPEPAPVPWLERPLLWWGELSGPLRSLADGSEVAEYVTASLAGSPRAVYRHLFSSSAEIDTVAWAAVIAVTSLLATIYFVAVIMALSMSFTLSRAVNRLSTATSAVRAGDFGARIPVRRRDQVGELQRSFNQMAENLESAVDAAAQAEILEKELEIARDLQQSLLPRDLPKSDSVEFATLFEPSAAIGGDYFDILRLDEHHLAVVTADVSGHGLPTGLRMAMLKAALTILVEEGRDTPEILAKLDRMIRTGDDARYFVTLTLARLDFRDGTLDLTNAGHPPTYLVRPGEGGDAEVEEIELPGPPLGALGSDYGRRSVALQPGDVVVWLSDGLIEATAESGEMFGYARVREALAGPAESPAMVRDRLLAAVARHTGGAAAEDDRTLVVMGYRLGL